MWIILNNAFYSIVENNYNSDELLVRSRVDGDIQKLFPNAQVLDADRGKCYSLVALRFFHAILKPILNLLSQDDHSRC